MLLVQIQFNTFTTILLAGLLLVIILLLIYLYRSQKQVNSLANKLSKIEGELHSHQLKDIDYKLNPHLFKNVLNSIQSHAYQTFHSLDSLSNVLDYILYESSKKFVTPQQEISFAMSLIEINKIKLSPLFDLKVKQKVRENEPLLNQKLMVPMLSTDLIENAFKHADIQSTNAFISVTFEFKDNVFSLTVANKISKKEPIQKDKDGYGSKMLEQRLNIVYKDNYKLDKFIEGDVYIAHLKINLLDYKAKVLAAR